MQTAARPDANRELAEALPLYVASLLVTLAGVGAVGVTLSDGAGWGTIWALLAVIGHLASYMLRRLRVSADAIFYPVMLLGCSFALEQVVTGGPIGGLATPISNLPPDLATATLVAVIAVVRTFTLVTNPSLLFSAVPAITMLALTASSNPNAEIPLFFGLLLLGSLFTTGYEAFLRRKRAPVQSTEPIALHLLSAWLIALIVTGAAVAFPVFLQPVIGQFSPYAMMSLDRTRRTITGTPPSGGAASVGTGPISLSPTPVFRVYSTEGGLYRTGAYTNYTGHGWTQESFGTGAPIHAVTRQMVPNPNPASQIAGNNLYEIPVPVVSDATLRTPTRAAQAVIATCDYPTQEIPAPGRIKTLDYTRDVAYLNSNGAVSGSQVLSNGRYFKVVSEIPEPRPSDLRAAPPVDLSTYPEPEALSLPQSTYRVQELARTITREAPAPYDRVQAIIDYINTHTHYTLLEEPTPPGEDAAAHYLFSSKRGACGLAATAAAIMCRAVGVPARVAVGYIADEPLPEGGGYLIRQSHAHMWVEAYFQGYGWQTFNPAPPMASLRENPLDLAALQFRRFLGKIGGGGLDAFLLFAAIAVTLAVVVSSLSGRGRRWLAARRAERGALNGPPAAAISAIYALALRMLQRRGWARDAWVTPLEYMRRMRMEWAGSPQAVEALLTLTGLLERALYAGDATSSEVAAARAALRTLRDTAPRRDRPRPTRQPAEGAA